MNEIINAEWARKTSNQILKDTIIKEISQCDDAIKSAVKRNELYCYVNLFGNPHTIIDLEKRGFSVIQHNNQKDGSTLQIKW